MTSSKHKAFLHVGRRIWSTIAGNGQWETSRISISPLLSNRTHGPSQKVLAFSASSQAQNILSRPFSNPTVPVLSEENVELREDIDQQGDWSRNHNEGAREKGREESQTERANYNLKQSLFPRLVQTQSLAGCIGTLSSSSHALERKDLEYAIEMLGRTKTWRVAYWVFKWMQTAENPNLRPTEKVCSNILGILANGQQSSAAYAVYKYMQAVGIPLTVHHYTPLVRSMCCRGRFFGAEDLIRQAMKEGEPPLKMLNALLKGYGDAGRLADMTDVAKRIIALGFRLDQVTYSNMIGCFARAGDLKKMEKTLAAMKEEGLQPNFIEYLQMAKAYRVAGAAEKWEKVFEEIEQQGDVTFIQTCMERFCFAAQQGNFGELTKLVEKLIQEDTHRTAVLMNCALQQYMERSRYMEYLDAISKFLESGYRPDKRTVLMILGEVGKPGATASQNTGCLRVLEKVDRPTGEFLKWLLKANEIDAKNEAEFWDRAKSWYTQLKEQSKLKKDNKLVFDVKCEVLNIVLTLGSKKVAMSLFKQSDVLGINFRHAFKGPVMWVVRLRIFRLEAARMVAVHWLYEFRKSVRVGRHVPDQWRFETGHRKGELREAIMADLRELYVPVKIMDDNPGYIGGTRSDLLLAMEENEPLLHAFEMYGLPV